MNMKITGFWDVMPWAPHYTTSSLHSCFHSWLYGFVIYMFFLTDMLQFYSVYFTVYMYLYLCLYTVYVYVEWYVKLRHREMEDLSMVGM
jgi:hypothetical protein